MGGGVMTKYKRANFEDMNRLALAKTGKTAEEIYKDNLKDFQVANLMRRYEITEEDDAYQCSKSNIHEYITQRGKNPYFEPRLELYNDRLAVTYFFRDKKIEEKYKNKPASKYDLSTAHLKGLTFEDMQLTFGNQQAVSFLKRAKAQLLNGKKTTGMWLVGANGIGKTRLMGCFLGELKKNNISFEIVGAHQFLNDLYSYMRMDGNNLKKRKDKLALGVDVLVIDDIGMEKASAYTVQTWGDILSIRYDNHLPTFVTSNLTKADYCKGLINNGVDRTDVERLYKKVINPLFQEIGMSGEDWRNKI